MIGYSGRNADAQVTVIEVRVQWGDTLWDLSQRLGLGVEGWPKIQAANGLKDDLIFAGEVLKVPLPLPRESGISVSVSGCKWRRRHTWPWVVQCGDTAWDISEKCGISLEDLQRANNYKHDCGSDCDFLLDLLYPGDVLQVPEKGPILKELRAPFFKPDDHPRVFPTPKDVDEYREKHRIFLNALRDVESSFMMPAPIGDGGLSIGPLQISCDYHTDAWWLESHGVNYEDCDNVDYSERTVINYWLRYCPWALELCDYETLARTHNGGPQFWLYLSTTRYWNRVRRAMKRFGYHERFPAFTASIGNSQTTHLFSSHIPFSIPLLDSKVSTAAIMVGTFIVIGSAAYTNRS